MGLDTVLYSYGQWRLPVKESVAPLAAPLTVFPTLFINLLGLDKSGSTSSLEPLIPPSIPPSIAW